MKYQSLLMPAVNINFKYTFIWLNKLIAYCYSIWTYSNYTKPAREGKRVDVEIYEVWVA